MKRPALGCTLVFLAASCASSPAKPATPALQSNAAEFRVEDSKIVSGTTGQPFSGTVVARGEEIKPLAKLVVGGTQLEAALFYDFTGFILSLPVVDGVPQGRATLHVEDGSQSALLAPVRRALTEARALSAEPIKLAEATLHAGRLEGRAVLLAPSSGEKAAVLADANFRAGLPHGTSREYHRGTTQVKSENTFENGNRAGPQRKFYEDGSAKSEAVFVDGAIDGVTTEYYKGGAKRLVATYKAGERVGETSWFPDGTKRHEIIDGPGPSQRTEWFSNGKLKSKTGADAAMVNPPDGLIVEYHDSGAVRSRTRYIEGVKEGAFEVFYANGQKWETGSFKDGVPDGPHKKWWKNGKPALDSAVAAGALDGPYKRWYASGTLWEQATYVRGARDGAYKKWWKNGALAHDYAYKGGKLEGTYKTFYDTGAKWAVYTYRDGKPTGVHKRWFPDGKLGFEKHHQDGKPHGPFRRWWPSGKPRLEASHVKGRLDGEFKNWLEDGSVYEMSTYENGRKRKTVRNL